MNLTTPKFIPQEPKPALIETSSSMLLIAIMYGDPYLRPGVNADGSGMKCAETHKHDIEACRFLSTDSQEFIDVAVGPELTKFCNKHKIVNARIKTSRPFTISMTDGGRLDDIPVISKSKAVVANNNVIIHKLGEDNYLLVDGNGGYMTAKYDSMVALRSDPRVSFYNF